MRKWAFSYLRSFPWRKLENLTPYRILLAELLLKRTTAVAAARAYESFLANYPTLEELSSATQDELELKFKPVGLYVQRARATARLTGYLAIAHAGTVPSDLNDLCKVPGLGPYSARAILSFGFGQPYAIVDSNVQRILRRVYGSQLNDKTQLKVYQRLADELLPSESHRQFNLGMLDLGALVCRPVNPKCNECPLSQICDFASPEAV